MIAREGVLAPEFSSIESWLGSPRHTGEYYRELQARDATYPPDQEVSVAMNVLAPVGRTRARYYLAGNAFPESVLAVAETSFTLKPAYPK
jgi:hypothetical protein